MYFLSEDFICSRANYYIVNTINNRKNIFDYLELINKIRLNFLYSINNIYFIRVSNLFLDIFFSNFYNQFDEKMKDRRIKIEMEFVATQKHLVKKINLKLFVFQRHMPEIIIQNVKMAKNCYAFLTNKCNNRSKFWAKNVRMNFAPSQFNAINKNNLHFVDFDTCK